MSRYFKLVNFELNRFIKIYLVLAGVIILSQIAGVILQANSYLRMASEIINVEMLSRSEFINQYGTMSFYQITQSIWFDGPIALSIVSLLIYVFFIWYRDWLGKNTFVYRLLMLPTARINIYLSKATVIFLMVLGLIALQLVLLPIEINLLKWMVPLDFRTDMSIYEILMTNYMTILIPLTITEFIINYGTGLMVVFIVFTAILFERSYRWKGILFGLIYGAFAVVLFFMPMILQSTILYEFFYPLELLALHFVTGLIVMGLSVWVGNFLLNKKIRI